MNFKAIFISFLTLVVFSTSQKGSAQKSELSSDFHRERRLQLREKLPSNSVAVFFFHRFETEPMMLISNITQIQIFII